MILNVLEIYKKNVLSVRDRLTSWRYFLSLCAILMVFRPFENLLFVMVKYTIVEISL